MSLNKPILDNRSYEQLRDELVQRIPVYAPEWTDHNPSDPGITLIELFAFLGENLLYRFNQIPEATFMEYLRLLQIPLQPAVAAKAMVAVTTEEALGVLVNKGSVAKAGETAFETLNEVRALPLSAVAVAKIAEALPEPGSEEEQFFEQAYKAVDVDSAAATAPYKSQLLWEDEPGVPVNFDNAVDGVIWVAVLAEDAAQRDSLRQRLADHGDAPLLLNLGFVPEIRLEPDTDTQSPAFAQRFRCPGEGATDDSRAVEWQIATGNLGAAYTPQYRALTIDGDTTRGLSQEGVVRVRLPRDIDTMGPYVIDNPDVVGTGDLPPPLDDELEQRLVVWLRAFRHDGSRFGRVVYVGANATQVIQTLTARTELLGTGDGQPNQTYTLVNRQVVPDSLLLEVETSGGWEAWQEVDGFFASAESDRHFSLDAQAGTVKFGNGLRGYVPQIGQRIRARTYRYGGGVSGNVAAEAIKKLSPNKPVKLLNPLPAYGGADAETIEKALDRIPGELRRRNRAVTRGDFRELALMTPGANIGRAECLPRYHPELPDQESAGVVSVIVFPAEDSDNPQAPLPNKNQLRAVCDWLDARRLVTTEHYVLPPKYRAIAIAVGIKVKAGFGIDAVRHWVELVIRQFLAPLPPFGPSGQGWPLGRRVHGPEFEAAAHQVEGVEYLEGLQVVGWDESGNRIDNTVELLKNEVPELIGITVEEGPVTVDPGSMINPASPAKPPVPIPVILDEC